MQLIAQLWSKVCYLTKPVGPVDKRKKEEIDGCRDAFLAFDTDRSGTIDLWELRQVLEVAFFLMYHIIFVALFFVTIFFFNIGKIPLLFVLIFFLLSLFCISVLAMGQKPTEEELFQMISEVDDNISGSIGRRS